MLLSIIICGNSLLKPLALLISPSGNFLLNITTLDNMNISPKVNPKNPKAKLQASFVQVGIYGKQHVPCIARQKQKCNLKFAF